VEDYSEKYSVYLHLLMKMMAKVDFILQLNTSVNICRIMGIWHIFYSSIWELSYLAETLFPVSLSKRPPSQRCYCICVTLQFKSYTRF